MSGPRSVALSSGVWSAEPRAQASRPPYSTQGEAGPRLAGEVPFLGSASGMGRGCGQWACGQWGRGGMSKASAWESPVHTCFLKRCREHSTTTTAAPRHPGSRAEGGRCGLSGAGRVAGWLRAAALLAHSRGWGWGAGGVPVDGEVSSHGSGTGAESPSQGPLWTEEAKARGLLCLGGRCGESWGAGTSRRQVWLRWALGRGECGGRG